MFSVEDFITKYAKYTDEELFEILSTVTGYSEEAQQALNIVIEDRGGQAHILNNLKEKQIIANEINRIKSETVSMGSKDIDDSFIKTVTSSDILSKEKVDEIIQNKYTEIILELDDKKVGAKTIIMGITGGVIATLIGGTLWGLQMIYSNRIFYIFIAGLVLLCYGIIKAFTKQSKKNTFVLIATIVAVILAILFGQLLYELIGYKS